MYKRYRLSYNCANTKCEKCEPLFTLQTLQWKVGSSLVQLNSFSNVLQKCWQTQSELDGVRWGRE